MGKDNEVKNILSQDVKLVITTVTIVASVLGSFYTLKAEVQLLSQKMDTVIAQVKTQDKALTALLTSEADLTTRVSILEVTNK